MHYFGLRGKILVLFTALIAMNMAGALVTLWYAQRTLTLFTDQVERGIGALSAAMELKSALVSQRGFVTYYFLNGDENWLVELDKLHQQFQEQLHRARESTKDQDGVSILNRIESEYLRHTFQRERVVELYQQGEAQAGAELHWDVRSHFFAVIDLCEAYKNLQDERLAQVRDQYHDQARLVSFLAWSALGLAVLLGFLLLYLLLARVLAPIHRLATLLANPESIGGQSDEVQYLGRKVQSLLQDVDMVQSKLARSREDLVHSERLALVGKLAAGVAHSVRNPLTSLKIRLFTLRRSLQLDEEQKMDFEVIDEEVSFIDTIIHNFLEFSRPPKLKMQAMSMSDAIDQALVLVRHRVESQGTQIVLRRERRLAKVEGDPEQLKEVVVNLLINAMDAMGEKGRIEIQEEEGFIAPYGDVCIVRLTDNGPGIPPHVQERIFEPFFSTKEEGTGLGLAIARRIVEEHGGWLHVNSEPGKGATFVIGLPRKEKGAWRKS